jgi:hypothetical protein
MEIKQIVKEKYGQAALRGYRGQLLLWSERERWWMLRRSDHV